MRTKLGQGLPVNIIVMLIIGLVIFGLGMGLFTKVFKSGDDQVEDLTGQIRENIAALECEGDEWICMPTSKVRNGKTQTFEAFIANRGEDTDKFGMSINLDEEVLEDSDGITNDCGTIVVKYLKNFETNVVSGQGTALPITVDAAKVSKTPCSFTKTVTLTKASDSNFEQKTSLIIRVE
jgi:hypothetical protein